MSFCKLLKMYQKKNSKKTKERPNHKNLKLLQNFQLSSKKQRSLKVSSSRTMTLQQGLRLNKMKPQQLTHS